MKTERYINLINDANMNELKKAISLIYTKSNYEFVKFPFVSLMNDDEREQVIEYVEHVDGTQDVLYAITIDAVEINKIEIFDFQLTLNADIVGRQDLIDIFVNVIDQFEDMTFGSNVAVASISLTYAKGL